MSEAPRLARWVLGVVVRPEHREQFLADADEDLAARVASHGPRSARRWYWTQTLHSLPSLLRYRLSRTGAPSERSRTRSMWHDLLGDARFAARLARRTPVVTVAIIATLALGIGVTSAVFTVMNAVLLRPLPFEGSDRVLRLGTAFTKGGFFAVVPYLDVQDYKAQTRVFSDVTAFNIWQSTLMQDGQPELVSAVITDDAFLRVLSLRVEHGRWFEPAETVSGGPAVVVLTHARWASTFGADPGVIGRTISLDGVPRTVVGVLAPSVFSYPTPDLGVLMPLRVRPGSGATSRTCRCFSALARVRSGVSLDEARAAVAQNDARVAAEVGKVRANSATRAEPLRDAIVGPTRSMLLLLAGAVAAVLLIACMNVANLLLARSQTRARELAVRAAIGASRGRLTRQVLAESVLTALAGGVLGACVAPVVTRLIVRVYPTDLPRAGEIDVDLRVVAVSAGLALLAGVLSGLPSARRMLSLDLTRDLRSGRGGDSRGRRRYANVLVAMQVALSLALVFSAGLLVRTFRTVATTDPGFVTANTLTFAISIPSSRYDTQAKLNQLLGGLQSAIGAIPGVRGVGLTSYLPFAGQPFLDDFVRTEIGDRGADNPKTAVAVVTPGYEHAIGMSILRGRGLSASSDTASPREVLVNDVLAHQAYNGADPMGRTIDWGGKKGWTIVGVVRGVRSQALWKEPDPELFVPATHEMRWDFHVVVGVSGEPTTLLTAIRRAVHLVDAAIPISDVAPMRDRVAHAAAAQRFRAALISALGVLALVLAAIGIYGVIASAVTRRTQEIGVRMALGEDASRVRRRVVADAMRMAVAGMLVGVAAALLSGRWLSSFLVGVSGSDAGMLGAAVAALATMTVAAAYIPARRASEIDPMVALRSD